MSNVFAQQRPVDNAVRIAVVGSGPGGFYAAEALLRSAPGLRVDMFEQLPVPYGLVRFGVAPDHPKLKQVTAVFERIARMPGFRFIGGVRVGRDVDVETLRARYHAVVLATGAERARSMDIPGEALPGSHSASEFVAWYNGHPDFRDRRFDLDQDVAVVVGHGNVALDVARMLVKTADELRRTDIAAHALDALAASRVREVQLVGRRGPAQTKFSEKELAEFQDLADCDTIVIDDIDPAGVGDAREQGTLALIETFRRQVPAKRRRCILRFDLSPIAIEGAGRVERIAFAQTSSRASAPVNIDCGLIFSSIGRRTLPIACIPYDEGRGVHANVDGRVTLDGAHVPGLYVCGWSKRGPSGTIGTNRGCSIATVEAVIADLPAAAGRELADADAMIADLPARAGRIVDFADWKKIDAAEVARGAPVGKPREKYISVAEMFAAVDRAPASALSQ